MLVECVEDSISRFVHCYLGSSGRRQSDIDGASAVSMSAIAMLYDLPSLRAQMEAFSAESGPVQEFFDRVDAQSAAHAARYEALDASEVDAAAKRLQQFVRSLDRDFEEALKQVPSVADRVRTTNKDCVWLGDARWAIHGVSQLRPPPRAMWPKG